VPRFEREANLLASLNHPSIAGIYGLERAHDEQFIVMDWSKGETLADQIACGAIPIPEALQIAGQSADALEAAARVRLSRYGFKLVDTEEIACQSNGVSIVLALFQQIGAQKCPVCGSQSVGPVMSTSPAESRRWVCRECERRRLSREQSNLRALGSYAARLLIYAGASLILLTLLADRLPIAGRSGFGWRQITGVEAGALCFFIGIVAGRALMVICGVLLLILSGGADLFEVGHAPGFGWRSQTVLAVSCLLVIVGMLWELAMRRQNYATRSPEQDTERWRPQNGI
jgi:hypothetical protein